MFDDCNTFFKGKPDGRTDLDPDRARGVEGKFGAAPTPSAAERSAIRLALTLNVAMFLIGAVVGYLADSTGVIADSLDMMTDAVGYALALMAITRGEAFKRNSARWTGSVLVVLGGGIAIEAIRRGF